jgi:hypothetical protein
MAKKPTLDLIGAKDGLPSFKDILALAEKLSGRPQTAEEIAQARALYDKAAS